MIRRIITPFYMSQKIRLLSIVSKQTCILDKFPMIKPDPASCVNDLTPSKNPISRGIRIGICKRGCNGLSFTMNYDICDSDTKTLVKDKDIIVKADNGVLIHIDPNAVLNIIDNVMVWKDDYISQEPFDLVFINPKSKGSCVCGERLHQIMFHRHYQI